MATPKVKTVEEYINAFNGDVKSRLVLIRDIVKKAAPKAEEVISYNMPLYKLGGMLVSFAAWKSHISLYPSPKTSGKLKKQIDKYISSKSTLQFQNEDPIPIHFISKIVKLRLKENLSRLKLKPSHKK